MTVSIGGSGVTPLVIASLQVVAAAAAAAAAAAVAAATAPAQQPCSEGRLVFLAAPSPL